MQSLLKGICAKEAGVRQASAFGIGVMAQFAGDHFSQHCLGGAPGDHCICGRLCRICVYMYMFMYVCMLLVLHSHIVM